MQKVPLYLGVFIEDNKSASKQIKNYVREALQELLDSHHQHDQQLQHDLNSFDQTFKPPADNYHLTTLFLGGNTKKLNPQQAKQFQNFKLNLKKMIKMECIIYIPGYIVCAYCPDTDGVEVDNKFPHVTLFLGDGAKAVESNIVIDCLAKKYPEIFVKKQFKTSKFEIEFNKFESVYMIKKRIQIKGVTGNNYIHGKK